MPTQRHSRAKTGNRICALFVLLAFIVGASPALLNIFVDPYQVFSSRERTTRINDIAEKKHYPLWKLAKYRHGTHDTIILGDSRARALRDKYWHELGMRRALNLAYGGGTIPEIYTTFQLVKNDKAIRNLVVGIQLRSFDEDHKDGMNRVPEAVKILGNRLEYLKNWTISKTAWKMFEAENESGFAKVSELKPTLVGTAKAGDLGKTGAVSLSKLLEPKVCFGCELPVDLASIQHLHRGMYHHGIRGYGYGHTGWLTALSLSKWEKLEPLYGVGETLETLSGKHGRQVKRNGKADWRGFEFSEKYWNHITDMASWAKDNEVNLIFVIPPTVSQMQQTIQNNKLGRLNHQFRVELAKLGTVIDLDFDNPLTRNISNFSDAYHFNSKIARMIVGEIAAHLTDDLKTQKLVAKRRKLITCSAQEKGATRREITRSVVLFEKRNCRNWRMKS